MINNDEINRSTLRSIPLFSEMNVEQLRKVTSFSRLKKYDRNDILFKEGDYYSGFFILLRGLIKVFKVSSDGKESVVHIVKPVSIFADIPLFEGGSFPVNAQSIDDSVVLFIPKEGFLDLIKADPDISFKMLAGFAKRMKALVNKLDDYSSKEVINRLARYIVKEIKNNGTIELPEPFVKLAIPKTTIAAYLGTITETLSRTFNKMQKEEIIRVQGKKIFVRDLKKLKELAGVK